MSDVVVFVVTSGNHMHLETIKQEEAEGFAQDVNRRTGYMPAIKAYAYTPTDYSSTPYTGD
jgi:hypothetical protein